MSKAINIESTKRSYILKTINIESTSRSYMLKTISPESTGNESYTSKTISLKKEDGNMSKAISLENKENDEHGNKFVFVSCAYGNSYYLEGQRINANTAKSMGYDVSLYSKESLVEDGFWDTYKDILDPSLNGGIRNGGCAWKPYIILKELNKMKHGDILFYSDAGDRINSGVHQFILNELSSKDYMFIENIHPHEWYTKAYCIIAMDCYTTKHVVANQLEAGNIALRKSDETLDLMDEWLFWCLKKEVILDDPMGYDDSARKFIQHSRDQSILTNIVVARDLTTTSIYEAMKYIKYNYYG